MSFYIIYHVSHFQYLQFIFLIFILIMSTFINLENFLLKLLFIATNFSFLLFFPRKSIAILNFFIWYYAAVFIIKLRYHWLSLNEQTIFIMYKAFRFRRLQIRRSASFSSLLLYITSDCYLFWCFSEPLMRLLSDHCLIYCFNDFSNDKIVLWTGH